MSTTNVVGMSERRVNPEKLQQWLEDAGVPRHFRELEIRTELVPPEIRAWASQLPQALGEGGSALLAGGPGCGKTVAAVWFLGEVFRRFVAPRDEGHIRGPLAHCRFLRSTDFVDALFRSDFDMLRHAKESRVLVLDDWGLAFDKSGWGASAFDDLIDRRWTEKRLTLVTTNLLPEDDGSYDATKCSAEDFFESRYRRAASRLFDKRGPGIVTVGREDLRR